LNKNINEVRGQLENRIDQGQKILNSRINNETDYKTARNEHTKWTSYNCNLLGSLFSSNKVSEDYRQSFLGGTGLRSTHTFTQEVDQFKVGVEAEITTLESIIERLEFYEPNLVDSSNQNKMEKNKVFIVHGHDIGIRNTIARFISDAGLEPIILDEQPNQGLTIFEKFERLATQAAFAVVLFTPDDIAYAKNYPDEKKSRARQNVIFELGYFVGVLGRGKVCVLCCGEIEILTDYQGILYIPFSMGSDWQIQLSREMKAAGLKPDLAGII
jgi:predicted nucleotide-binding protein